MNTDEFIAIRKKLGKTQKQMAELLGVSGKRRGQIFPVDKKAADHLIHQISSSVSALSPSSSAISFSPD